MGATIWSVGGSGKLSLKTWADDDLGLVFDSASGDTHLLDHSAIEILQSLAQAPGSIETLTNTLEDRFASEDQAQIPEFIATTLLQLREIGLVFEIPG